MVKVVSLFLIVIVVLAMFGRLRMPRLPFKTPGARLSRKCPDCGRYKIGTGPCPCHKG